MNQETTCCQTAEPSTADINPDIRPAEEHPRRPAQPTWTARRHEGGTDIEIALPGVRKEDLSLEVQSSRLSLDARRNAPNREGQLIHGDPAPDGYQLELRLGSSLDGSSLKAQLEAGLLRLRIPLVEAAQPRRIEIR